MATLDELTRPLTRTEVQTKIYTAIAALGVDTTVWKSGAVVRTMIAACSIMIAAFSTLVAAIARSGFLELAEGAWLTHVAHYVYGVDRDEATFATGFVTLTNAGGGIYDLDPGDLVLANGAGKQYRNVGAVSLDALSSATIAVRAVEAGSASTTAAGTVTELVTPLLGVSATNALAIVGRDEERDPALRARCYEMLGALSPMGPWDAYSYAARNALRADGSSIGVARVRTVKDGFGNVTTYVATSSGAVAGTEGNPASDLGIIAEAVQQSAAPLAVTAHIASASTLSVAVTYKLWIYNTTGLSPAQIQAAITARLVAFMSSVPIGGHIVGGDPGKVFVDAIRTTIGATLPEIFHVEVTAPAADVVLSISQVPVLGLVTATSITQVPPSEGAV